MNPPILHVSDLNFQLKKRVILEDVSFEIKAGEICYLLGKNGSGKTSVLRCISLLEDRYSGTIKFCDDRVGNNMFKDLGVFVDGISLYSHLSVYQNLNIFRRYYGLSKTVIEETLQLANLANESKVRVRELSSGQRQRLGLGVALIHKPKLLIADEPLNALDVESINNFQNIVMRMSRESKTAFLISGHSVEESSGLYDRIILLRAGSLALNATKDQLSRFLKYRGNADANFDYQLYQSEFHKRGVLSQFSVTENQVRIYGEQELLESAIAVLPAGQISWSAAEQASVNEILNL